MTGFEVARARGLPPTLVIECQGNCTHAFPVAEGYPFPVWFRGAESPQMAFFCSPACFLALLEPRNCAGRA